MRVGNLIPHPEYMTSIRTRIENEIIKIDREFYGEPLTEDNRRTIERRLNDICSPLGSDYYFEVSIDFKKYGIKITMSNAMELLLK